MKRTVILILILISANILTAQTKVVKRNATKSTDYGVTYYLPKTVLTVQVNYSKTTQKAGLYAHYAERYLGVNEKSVVLEDQVYYTLNKIGMGSKGVIDKDASYLVEFKAKTGSPFVFLTEEGIICTINADYSPEPVKNNNAVSPNQQAGLLTINPQSIFTEEYLNATSIPKKAEVLAKQIYKLRESRSDLLTGEADNAPRDGEGMKILLSNLEAKERALVELFLGTTTVESFDAEFELEPLSDIEREVLFRFSKYNGIVEPDDLSGSPVYINVRDLNITEDPVPVDPKLKAKIPQSIVYNVPGKADVEIFYGLNSMYKNSFPIVQFGYKQVLAPSLFDDKKGPVRVYFYPETGGIKQIIQ
jgi:hypothetical protein